jgi:hypothetical protein
MGPCAPRSHSGPSLINPAHLEPLGMATRNVKAAPRGKPSGIPFLARFADVGEAAGLTAPTIYGGVDHKDYIVETMG